MSLVTQLQEEIEALAALSKAQDEALAKLEARLAGVDAGTHVIVPVEPTEAMVKAVLAVAGDEVWDADVLFLAEYQAMLEAVDET